MSRSVRQRSRGPSGSTNRWSQEPPTRHDRSANFSFSSLQVGTTSSNEANAFASAQRQPEQQGHVINPRSPFAPAYQSSRSNGRLSPQPPRSPHRTPLSPGLGQSQSRTTIALAPPPFERARSGSPYAVEGHPAHLAPRHLSFSDLTRPDADDMPSTSGSRHLKASSMGDHLKSPDGAESSYSFSAEDDEYKRMAAEAARSKMSRSSLSRKARRSSRNKSDDALYMPGDDDSADSDDNPDINDGVARGMSHRVADRRGLLQHADDISYRRRRPSTVPEDEGVASETDSPETEKNVRRSRSRSVASPTPHLPPQIIHVVEDGLPSYGTTEWGDARSAVRQAADKLRDVVRWVLRLDKPKLAAIAFALASVWCMFLLSRSARSSPGSLPADFDEMASRLRGVETMHAEDEMATAKQLKAFEHRLKEVEVGHFRLSDLARQQTALNVDMRRTKDQMVAVTGRIDKLEHRVTNLEGKVSNALHDGSLAEALDKILPSRMPFVKNAKGEWTIPDSFFVDFKRLLFGSGELEETIRQMLNEGVETQRKTWQAEVSHDTEVLEAMLQTLFDKRIEPEVQGYLDRSTFIKSLESKLADLRREIRHVQDNGSTALSKLKIGSKNGQDLHDVVAGIVDAMLLKYSKDKTGLADYALFSAGARVIEETTSPSLQLSRPSLFGRVGFGQKPVHGKVPQVALHPDTTVGQCWAFAGGQGDLGVLLSHSNIVVSAITVDHVSMDLAPDVSSAPKDIEVWATLEGEDNFAKARKYLEVSPYIDEPTSMPQTEQNVLLAKVTYDIHSAQATQTFPIPEAFVELGIDTRAVTFRIQSNWGSDVTCLYRVRVHGKQAATTAELEE